MEIERDEIKISDLFGYEYEDLSDVDGLDVIREDITSWDFDHGYTAQIVIFKYNDKFYKVSYTNGGDNIDLDEQTAYEVFPVEKTIIAYE